MKGGEWGKEGKAVNVNKLQRAKETRTVTPKHRVP
jgi:hypothetical protein